MIRNMRPYEIVFWNEVDGIFDQMIGKKLYTKKGRKMMKTREKGQKRLRSRMNNPASITMKTFFADLMMNISVMCLSISERTRNVSMPKSSSAQYSRAFRKRM